MNAAHDIIAKFSYLLFSLFLDQFLHTLVIFLLFFDHFIYSILGSVNEGSEGGSKVRYLIVCLFFEWILNISFKYLYDVICNLHKYNLHNIYVYNVIRQERLAQDDFKKLFYFIIYMI